MARIFNNGSAIVRPSQKSEEIRPRARYASLSRSRKGRESCTLRDTSFLSKSKNTWYLGTLRRKKKREEKYNLKTSRLTKGSTRRSTLATTWPLSNIFVYSQLATVVCAFFPSGAPCHKVQFRGARASSADKQVGRETFDQRDAVRVPFVLLAFQPSGISYRGNVDADTREE